MMFLALPLVNMSQNADCPTCQRLQAESKAVQSKAEEAWARIVALKAKLLRGRRETAPLLDQGHRPPIRNGRSIGTREVVFVFLIFFLSRLVIFSAMTVSPRFVTRPTGPIFWDLGKPVLRPLFRWDAGWYLHIAENGYSYNGNPRQQQDIAFFPLYPLTCRLCRAVTGISIPLCAVLLSNLAFLVGLVALYALVTWEIGSDVARSTTLLLAFFPASLFFSTMYTESFFLAFSVLAYVAFRKQRFVQGGIWAGLASATRAPGILLFIPLFLEGFPCLKERRMWWRVIAAGLLAASGLGGFMLYQWIAFGDPLVSFKVHQQAPEWRGEFALPFRRIAEVYGEIFSGQLSPDPFDVSFALMFIALACTLPSHLPRSYALYTILGVALPLLAQKNTYGLTRYFNVLFPGFMALGIIGRKSRSIPWVCLALFIVVLVYFSMRFAQWRWVG
jgi:hypothetical protein